MGGSPSKKENFPDISLSQEQIDKIYANFSEFSKSHGGKSGDFISVKAVQKLLKPSKGLGKKIHAFLTDQSITQTLNFNVFLYFVEFFFQTQSYLRQDARYREYSILEMFSILSFYSSVYKNKQTDKEYIQRLPVTFRQGLEFTKELHGIIGILSGKKSKKEFDNDETIPKKIATLIFGTSYELNFRSFIEKTLAVVPNAEKIIQLYFKKIFYTNEKKATKTEQKSEKQNEMVQYSSIFNHNAVSNLSLFISQFSEKSQYRERVFCGRELNYDYHEFGRAISLGNNFNVLLFISHLVDIPQADEETDVVHKSIAKALNDKEKHVIGLYLPKQQVENASFFQIQPDFSIIRNNGKKNFFNIDQSATVIFFGEGDQDILFLNTELTKESYIKTNNPLFATYGSKPHNLKIDQIEIWVTSDSPIDMKTVRPVETRDEVINSQVVTLTTTSVTPQPQPERIVIDSKVSSQSYYIVNQNEYQSSQIRTVY